MATAKTSKSEELLSLLNSRLTLSQTFSKDWEKNVKKWLADYNIESFDKIDFEDLHNVLQIPYIFSTIESGLPTMFESIPELLMTKRGKRDKEFTEFAQKIWDYAKTKANIEDHIEDVGMNFLITGLGNGRYGWKLRTKKVQVTEDVPLMQEGQPVLDEQGQPIMTQVLREDEEIVEDRPMVESYDYDKIWFSPDSKFVMEDVENKIPYTFCLKKMTKDAIKEVYGKTVKDDDLETLNVQEYDESLTEKDIKEKFIKDDLKRGCVFHYFGTLPKKYLLDEESVADWSSENVYHATFVKGKILEKPELYDKKPTLLVGNYGTPMDFWRFGEPKIMRELEQDASLGRSIMSDYRDRVATKLAMPHGTEADEEALKSPRKFQIVRFIGQQYPQYIAPPSIPDAVIATMSQSRSDIQMVSAQLDLARGGTQSIVESATGQKIFQASTEKRIARKRKKIGQYIQRLAKNILVLCAENWDIATFAKITDLSEEEITQGQFIEKLKRIGEEYDVVMKVEDVMFNKESKKAQAIAMYRELKNNPLINQQEILKTAIKIGFDEEDVDRYMNITLTPDMLMKAIGQLSEMGFVDEQIAIEMQNTMAQMLQQQNNPNAEVGRPATQNPVDVVENSMPGSDDNQIQAQNASSYKQVGVPK